MFDIQELEDKCGNLVVEKNSLQSETDEWKKRSDQLVEKSFKMNPDELKRLQVLYFSTSLYSSVKVQAKLLRYHATVTCNVPLIFA